MNRLNFGCGSIQPAGWVNLDRDDHGQGAQEYGDISGLLVDTFDIIVAHCSLQMTEYNDVPATLCALHKVLKPGGVLRISLPDIYRGFRAYATGEIDWFPNGEDSIDDRFSNWLTWYSTTRSLWTPQAIKDRLLEAGFVKVYACSFGESTFEGAAELDSRRGECFFVEAVK